MTYVLLFVVLWTVAVFTEVTIAAVSLRGTIYNDRERAAAEYLLYARLGEEARLARSLILLPLQLLSVLLEYFPHQPQKQAGDAVCIGFGTYGDVLVPYSKEISWQAVERGGMEGKGICWIPSVLPFFRTVRPVNQTELQIDPPYLID